MLKDHRLYLIARCIPRLGFGNVLRVLWHRIQCKAGFFKWRAPIQQWKHSDTLLFCPNQAAMSEADDDIKATGRKLWKSTVQAAMKGDFTFFFHNQYNVGETPNWELNPLTGTHSKDRSHWSAVPHYPAPGEDIKCIWEISRFYWAPQFALAYRSLQDPAILERLNDLFQDWVKVHPINQGYQWVCGQEVAIRLINTVLAADFLNQQKPSSALIEFITTHCQRVALTLGYAIGQSNNHPTSEAAGLFIGASWLLRHAKHPKAQAWQKMGRKSLDKRLRNLVIPDGTFSQQSSNYHRVFLDATSISLVFAKRWGIALLSSQATKAYKKAAIWLKALMDTESGYIWNLAGNDGARIFHIDECDYRDFRPSVQLASMLSEGEAALPEGSWDTPWKILGLKTQSPAPLTAENRSCNFPDGGMLKLAVKNSFICLRYPRYCFRPPQADLLHLDYWYKGENILLDTGLYSYNSTEGIDLGLSSAHNTVRIDEKEPMRKISRFLYADWPQASVTYCPEEKHSEASYQTYWGAAHRRGVRHQDSEWHVVDTIKGAKKCVDIYWQLAPGEWRIEGNRCIGKGHTLELSADGIELELEPAWRSVYYQSKDAILRLHGKIRIQDDKAVKIHTAIWPNKNS